MRIVAVIVTAIAHRVGRVVGLHSAAGGGEAFQRVFDTYRNPPLQSLRIAVAFLGALRSPVPRSRDVRAR